MGRRARMIVCVCFSWSDIIVIPQSQFGGLFGKSLSFDETESENIQSGSLVL